MNDLAKAFTSFAVVFSVLAGFPYVADAVHIGVKFTFDITKLILQQL